MTMSLGQLAREVGASLHGDGDVTITGCAPIRTAGPNEVTFLANRKYARYLPDTRAAGVLVDPRMPCPDHVTRLVCDDPYFAFRNALVALYGYRTHPPPMDAEPDAAGRRLSPRASVHETATIGDGTAVHPHATIEAGVVIGARCVLYPGVFVGPDARLGDDCVLFPNVTVYDRCTLGDRVILHASTVIGQDGFGYATHGGRHEKIPQTGTVEIGSDVELGAGCAIERAAIGRTSIGDGTKFADLISIGHGTTIGEHCLFVSLVGVSGSVDIGRYVVLGGQVGVSGHLRIGDGVQAMGKTAIAQDVPAGKKVGGVPAVDSDIAKRNAMASQDLYGLVKRVRSLERQLAAMREQAASPDSSTGRSDRG
ncbi:MAG: UDP-3-O-(3-hydroxymyristoyl)glucosamine N-acyltransferase [Phycisphaerales bacterium]|nr:UDP-3-O-(3-hydroxymyristoyl)glucosamine N-acyltransferase [Phycisphaerales bacterium]